MISFADQFGEDWIDWCGGEMPVAHSAIVEVLFRLADYETEHDSDICQAGNLMWGWAGSGGDIVAYRVVRSNPLAAMCHHKDTHSTERLPVPPASTTEESQASTAKEDPAGINTVAGFDHRPGAWK